MKFNELGRSFFRKMVQIRRNFVTTCTVRSTRGAKLPVDATFSGRSMVEMLGVLAIIGVLSIGAIAGYSKAMMKYKLNKYANDLSVLFFNIYDLQKGNNNLLNLPLKYILPESLAKKILENKPIFYDVFGNYWGLNQFGIYTRMGYDGSNAEASGYARNIDIIKMVCPIIFQTAKDIKVKELTFYTSKGSTIICDRPECHYSYSELTITKISEFCDTIINADNGNAIMYFYF